MCSLAEYADGVFLLLTFIAVGVGCALSTIAFTIFAIDFSRADNYTSILKNYQAAYSVGGLISSLLPGILADWTGSSAPAYRIFFLFACLIEAGVLYVYWKAGMIKKNLKM